MIDDGFRNKIYEETANNALKNWKNFQEFCIEILKIIKIMTISDLQVINRLSYIVQPNLSSLRI